MSHHGREDEVDHDRIRYLEATANKYALAVQFIQSVAVTPDTDWATRAAKWLDDNGLPGPRAAERARVLRANQLDAEIARLQAEREKL